MKKMFLLCLWILAVIPARAGASQKGPAAVGRIVRVCQSLPHADLIAERKLAQFLLPHGGAPCTGGTDWLLVGDLYQLWVNGAWADSARGVFSYDQSGREIGCLSQIRRNDAWWDTELITKSYDAYGHESVRLQQIRSNDAWINDIRDTYTYNAAGMVTEDLGESWSEGGGWENSARTTNTYFAGKTITQSLMQIWLFGAWINALQITMTYDENQRLVEEELDGWIFTGWGRMARFSYSYDQNGDLSGLLTQILDNGAWANSSMSWYTRDAATGNVLSELFQTWYGDAWHDSLTTAYAYNQAWNDTCATTQYVRNGVWLNLDRHVYSYSLGTGVTDTRTVAREMHLQQNFPNPFNPTTNVPFVVTQTSCVTLKVFDLRGREVVTLVNGVLPPGTYTIRWNAADRPSGTYYYQYKAGRYSEVRKMELLK